MKLVQVAEKRIEMKGHGCFSSSFRGYSAEIRFLSGRASSAVAAAMSTPTKENAAMEKEMLYSVIIPGNHMLDQRGGIQQRGHPVSRCSIIVLKYR